MKSGKAKFESGFTMIELMVAFVVGLIVLGAATELFKAGMDVSAMVAERAEMQQNARAALNLISRDVSMAGAGLPTGGLHLPGGAGSSLSFYGRNQAASGCYLVNCKYTPNNFLYAVISGAANGNENGVPTPATNSTADSVTVAYVDYGYPLNLYTVSFPDPNGGSIRLDPPAVLPAAGLPAVNDPAVGIKPGDLILLSNNRGTVVAEATNMSTNSITFADLDALNMNQSGAQIGNVKLITAGTNTVAYRLLIVTYFLEIPTNGNLPRLMRQVSGHDGEPVADNIINVQLSYDSFDEVTSTGTVNQKTPADPNQIRKINIAVMGQSLRANGKSQNIELATSVSARSLSFHERYK